MAKNVEELIANMNPGKHLVISSNGNAENGKNGFLSITS